MLFTDNEFQTAKRIIHFELLNEGQTIIAEIYCFMLQGTYEKLWEKQPAFINRKGPLLSRDNARPPPPHTT